MGCGSSSSKKQARSEENGEVAHEQVVPPIDIRVGDNVKPFTRDQANIVFIFGGPSSRKGALTDELLTTFDFMLISAEEMILNYLPNKAGNTAQSTQEIQDILKEDPTLLTLDWVLQLMSQKMSTTSHKTFLVDIVPNLMAMMRIDTFMRPDISQEMSRFEGKHKVNFAINLASDNEDLESMLADHAAKLHELAGTNDEHVAEEHMNGTEEGGDAAQAKEKEKEKFAFKDSTDEADTSRTKKRRDLYNQSASPFLSYFQQSNRLVNVTVPSKDLDRVIQTVKDLMIDLKFYIRHNFERLVLLFIKNESILNGFDPSIYDMGQFTLSSILPDDEAGCSMDDLITALVAHVQKLSANGRRHFIVVLDCISDTEAQNMRRTCFFEMKETLLESVLTVPEGNTGRYEPLDLRLRSMTTSRNFILLFTQDIDPVLCRTIGNCLITRNTERLKYTAA